MRTTDSTQGQLSKTAVLNLFWPVAPCWAAQPPVASLSCGKNRRYTTILHFTFFTRFYIDLQLKSRNANSHYQCETSSWPLVARLFIFGLVLDTARQMPLWALRFTEIWFTEIRISGCSFDAHNTSRHFFSQSWLILLRSCQGWSRKISRLRSWKILGSLAYILGPESLSLLVVSAVPLVCGYAGVIFSRDPLTSPNSSVDIKIFEGGCVGAENMLVSWCEGQRDRIWTRLNIFFSLCVNIMVKS